MKRHPKGWEKVVANFISSKGLISRIYKELLQINNKMKTTYVKMGKDLNKHFFREGLQIAIRA